MIPTTPLASQRNPSSQHRTQFSSRTVLSVLAQSAVQLGALRVLTGIGVGAILASSNVIAAEYANRHWRGLAVSLNSTGYAVGATAGGIIAAALQDAAAWRPVLAFGAVATAPLIPVVLWRLPESLDFLLTQRTLNRLNKLLTAMRHPAIDDVPPASSGAGRAPAPRLAQILAPSLRRNTLLTWAGFFLVMFGFYSLTSWTPKLLVEAGMSADQGVTGGVLLNLGGIFGTALLGLLAARFASSTSRSATPSPPPRRWPPSPPPHPSTDSSWPSAPSSASSSTAASQASTR